MEQLFFMYNHKNIVMNQFINSIRKTYSRIALFFSMLLLSVVSFAQDTKQVDINVNTKGDGGFFQNPVVWVVGGAVFILLLVALIRNNRSNA
jgi:hypothetical protein